MIATDTQSGHPPARRVPERQRRRQLTACPKIARTCVWPSIQRSETRLAGLTMAAAASTRRANC